MTSTDNLEQRTITIERTFDAPLDLVWEAWTQPEHIAHWWGPKGMNTQVETHEFKVGGRWKYTMDMPDGKVFVTEGQYIAIEEKERIVTTADFKPMTEGVELHILLEAKGDQTLFTFKVVHETVAYAQQQEKMGIYNGWGSTFDRLTEFLAEKVA